MVVFWVGIKRKSLIFFDINQHLTKMVTIIPIVAMFVRGDVKPGKEEIAVYIDKKRNKNT